MSEIDAGAADAVAFGDLRASLGLQLRLAQVALFDAFYETLSEHGLKPGEFTMLRIIELNPGTRQGVIARRLRIKPAHMTKLVQRNVEKGLVARDVADDDRRAVQLSLTPAGLRFVAARKAQFLDFAAEGTMRLTALEHRTLVGLLQKLNGMEPAD